MGGRFPEPLTRLVEALKKLPGVGPKSAQRMAFYILQAPPPEVETLRQAIAESKVQLKRCQSCFNIGSYDPCEICSDPSREGNRICVVAEWSDVMVVERSGSHRGVYHVLGGLLSPVEGVTADRLTIDALVTRISNGEVREVILALNPTPEGEATLEYLTQALQGFPVTLNRIGLGLPVGAEMEYADELTLRRAFEGRKSVGSIS